MQEDKKLKRFLVLQSFCPLFLLIFIRHVGRGNIFGFIIKLLHGDWLVLHKIVVNPALGDEIITLLCILWFILTAFVAFGFRNLQTSNFTSHGETINIGQEKKDSGVTFLVTFILPLLVDDVSTLRGFIFFVVLLGMIIFLLVKSDLFYQNPVLVALRYRIYEFQFVTHDEDVNESDKIYIGMSQGDIPSDKTAIKRKYIADNVFLIYNE